MRRRYRFVLAVVMLVGLAAVWLTAMAPPAAAIDGSDPRERFRMPGGAPGYGDPDDYPGGGLVYVDRSAEVLSARWMPLLVSCLRASPWASTLGMHTPARHSSARAFPR